MYLKNNICTLSSFFSVKVLTAMVAAVFGLTKLIDYYDIFGRQNQGLEK